MIYTSKIIQLYEQADMKALWPLDDKQVSTYSYGSVSDGLEIIFQIYKNNDSIEASRYKVFGCGYSIALSVWLSQWIYNKNQSTLNDIELSELIETFYLPKAKYKCALAIINIYQQILS
jgi:NifU-like protein involved in Fe-S cluster formation